MFKALGWYECQAMVHVCNVEGPESDPQVPNLQRESSVSSETGLRVFLFPYLPHPLNFSL